MLFLSSCLPVRIEALFRTSTLQYITTTYPCYLSSHDRYYWFRTFLLADKQKPAETRTRTGWKIPMYSVKKERKSQQERAVTPKGTSYQTDSNQESMIMKGRPKDCGNAPWGFSYFIVNWVQRSAVRWTLFLWMFISYFSVLDPWRDMDGVQNQFNLMIKPKYVDFTATNTDSRTSHWEWLKNYLHWYLDNHILS